MLRRKCRRWWHSRPVKKWRRRWHDRILKIITAATVIAYFAAASYIDSPEWSTSDIPVQLAVCGASVLWWMLFGIANNWFYEDEEEEEPWDI